jgi:hypothetical protein
MHTPDAHTSVCGTGGFIASYPVSDFLEVGETSARGAGRPIGFIGVLCHD